MDAVRDHLADFGDETDVVLITFTDRAGLAAYAAERRLPFPIIVDRDRAAYRAFGLGRGTVRRVWGVRALRRYVDIVRSEGLRALRGLRRPTEDTLQLGGDFVIDPDGVLRYGFWGEGPDDRPTIDQLIAAVAEIRRAE